MCFLFCNIAWMSYYKGNLNGEDEPHGGGSYVQINKKAHEEYNFEPIHIEFEDDGFRNGEYCLGFVETKSTNGINSNQLSIEKIPNCEGLKKESQAKDITVVYCARYPFSEKRETVVVGWYKHATIFRNYEKLIVPGRDGNEEYLQLFNAFARREDVVLLPSGVRRRENIWVVPRKSGKGQPFGFGQSNVWFANEQDNPKLQEFLTRLSKQIEEYDGENWIDRRAE